MSRLAIYLLGTPRVEIGPNTVDLNRRKALALLFYLSSRAPAPNTRCAGDLVLARLRPNERAGNLRRTLFALNKLIDADRLEVDRDTIALARQDDLWIDVDQFERLLASCHTHGHTAGEICAACLTPLADAVTLYRDDFLTGFTLSDSPAFDEWQVFQAESLRRTLSHALARLVRGLAATDRVQSAVDYARRRVALDPLHEPAQCQLIRAYAWAGERGAAMRQYEELVRLLAAELDAQPAEETTRLYTTIASDALPPPEPLAPPIHTATTQDWLATTAQPASTTSAVQPETVGALRTVTILCAGPYVAPDIALDQSPEDLAAHADRLLGLMTTAAARYEAHIEPLAGDTVIALFGVTRSHEDDAERRVACGDDAATCRQRGAIAGQHGDQYR